MKYLVTGGAGFIGSVLIEFLLKKTKNKIISIDNYSSGSKKNHVINKRVKYENEIDKIQSRLDNKNFVDRAPKHIVDQEKSIYNNLKNDINKISLTLKSL